MIIARRLQKWTSTWFWFCSLFTVWLYYLISLFSVPSCVKWGSTSTYYMGWGEDKMRRMCQVLRLLPGRQQMFEIEIICFFTSNLQCCALIRYPWAALPRDDQESYRVQKVPGAAPSEIQSALVVTGMLSHESNHCADLRRFFYCGQKKGHLMVDLPRFST